MKILKLVLILYLSCTAILSATLFNEVTGLSAPAQSSLIAHYDGRSSVDITGSTVNSWTPVDGNGVPLPTMAVTSAQRGSGAADLITYDGTGSLIFDDPSVSADGRFLQGTLANSAGSEFTVIWLGHYKSSAHFATSGTYAYNIGPSNISHQRDDFGGGFRVEMYDGTTYGGDDITALDDTDTVWSTVITASSHTAYANGINLNIAGTPSNNVVTNAGITFGAFSASGFDFVGEISHLLVFESSLSDADRQLIEGWLAGQVPPPDPDPVSDLRLSIEEGMAELTWTEDAQLLSSDDLQEWYVEAEAISPMTWSIERDHEFFKLVDTFSEVPKGAVFRTRVETYTWRDIEYHLDTGDLYLVGEQTHGLDFYDASGNDYWWCYMNSSSSGSGLLEFLMDNNLDAAAMKSASISGGWTSYTGANYSFLTFEPLASQKTYVNSEAPSSPGGLETTEAYTADYASIPTGELHFTVYRNSSSGLAYFGLSGSSLETVVSPSSPPGDGTANRDNGARYDIAFKTNVPLSNEKKLELLNSFAPVQPQYDDAAEPYYIVHPSGL
jgi:hypothetical protein